MHFTELPLSAQTAYAELLEQTRALELTNALSGLVGSFHKLARTAQALAAAPASLLVNPRIGEKLDEFDPREVRRIPDGKYEIRHEIQESTIYVLRLWHTRENR